MIRCSLLALVMILVPLDTARADPLADCLGKNKKPAGAPDKKAKFAGAWSCIATGANTGNATAILSPGDAGQIDATMQTFYDGYKPRTLSVTLEQHGAALWKGDDDGTQRADLVSGVIKWTTTYFYDKKCYVVKLTCTPKK